jgi:dihydrodipicolinate synthase/N-acetylneuraminate lyase
MTTPDPATLAPTGNLGGLFVDLVVPLDSEGTILERDLIVHIQHMARTHTVNGVIMLGSAAEFARFDDGERRRLMEIGVAAVPEGFPCGMGIHAATPDEVLAQLDIVNEVGGGGGCVFAPEVATGGAFVAEVAASSEMFLLADLGAAPGTSLDLAQLDLAAEHERVEGIRTQTIDPAALAQERALIDGRASLVGAADGAGVMAQLEAHTDSAMLTSANAFPELWGRCVTAALEGDWDRAHTTFADKLQPVLGAIGTVGAERHTAGIKSLLALLRVFSDPTMRDDSSPADDDEVAQMTALLVGAGLILG